MDDETTTKPAKVSKLTEEEVLLVDERKALNASIFDLLYALVASPHDEAVVAALVECGRRLESINTSQQFLIIQRKSKLAHNMMLIQHAEKAAEKSARAAEMDAEKALKAEMAAKSAERKAKADCFLGQTPPLQRIVETPVQKEVNRQLRSNGGVIRLESGDGR